MPVDGRTADGSPAWSGEPGELGELVCRVYEQAFAHGVGYARSHVTTPADRACLVWATVFTLIANAVAFATVIRLFAKGLL